MMRALGRRLAAVTIALAPLLLVSTSALPLFAQGPGGGGEVVDFRGKVTFAYGTVVTVIIVYLVLSQRRNSGLREEMKLLEERLRRLDPRLDLDER